MTSTWLKLLADNYSPIVRHSYIRSRSRYELSKVWINESVPFEEPQSVGVVA